MTGKEKTKKGGGGLFARRLLYAKVGMAAFCSRQSGGPGESTAYANICHGTADSWKSRSEYTAALEERAGGGALAFFQKPEYNKTNSMQGSLRKQAERKSLGFDPLPDVDNAAVGSIEHAPFQEDATKGILLFLLSHRMFRKEDRKPRLWRAEGERPEPCISAMGSRVPA